MDLFKNIEDLIQIEQSDFDDLIYSHLQRKHDEQIALKDLDLQVRAVANMLQDLSMEIKVRLLVNKATQDSKSKIKYSMAEVAAEYKVDKRTVHNWIKNGLKVERISKTKLFIYHNDLDEYKKRFLNVEPLKVAFKKIAS
jgi:predicted DNA-binding protein YlxM (UPF0122 family)